MIAHFGSAGSLKLEGLATNLAGFPVLVGKEGWTWEDMILFYAERLQRSFTCEMARPTTDEQIAAKPKEGVAGTFRHVARFEARSPITLMPTHYHQQLKYGTGVRCHLTGLSMVAEVSHPLKISLGHRIYGWKMWHGWSVEVPKSFADDFCEDANNIVFESWWANCWRRGWRCLLASLPRRLDWALDWLERAGELGLVERFTEQELCTIRNFYFANGKAITHRFRWARDVDPRVNINVLSPTEQIVVWQRVYGSNA